VRGDAVTKTRDCVATPAPVPSIKLSREARAERAPRPPEELVDAAYDRIHSTSGRLFAAKAIKIPDRIEQRPLDSLVPYARNARTHSDRQVAEIAASIREFGWTNPVLVDGDNGIIAGHGRVLAARKLGIADVPVIELAGLSEAQKRAYVIADNKLALNAGWDEDLLALEFGDLASLGFDLSLTGFGEDEIGILLNRGNEGLTDPDDVPDVPAQAVSRLGDVWLLGKHRLVCGDSTSADDVAKALDGVKPHLLVTDPPYGISYDPSWRERFGDGDHCPRQGAQRRPCRLARGVGAVSRRRRLCLAWRSSCKHRGGEPRSLRLCHPLSDHLGQDPAGDRPRRLSLAARARLVCRQEGQQGSLGRRSQADHRLADSAPQERQRPRHAKAR